MSNPESESLLCEAPKQGRTAATPVDDRGGHRWQDYR